jgi:hypothetical protein
MGTRILATMAMLGLLTGCADRFVRDEPADAARRVEALLTHQGRVEQAVCLDRGLEGGTPQLARCMIREAERRAREAATTPTIRRRLPPHGCWNEQFALALRCYDI